MQNCVETVWEMFTSELQKCCSYVINSIKAATRTRQMWLNDCSPFHADWHLLLFLFEHRFVINQSGHVVSAVTAEIALIWTTPLGQTWSLTLMPFSARGTFLPPFTPHSLIPKSRGKRLPRHLSVLNWKLKEPDQGFCLIPDPLFLLHMISAGLRTRDSAEADCLKQFVPC